MDNERLLVSIVIPTYNHCNFLGRALQGLLDQSYSNWEAIIVDNHSQDSTNEVIKSFDDARIRSIKINNNGVIAASRNLGIKESKGSWIAFLDSDDWWKSDKLQFCIQQIDDRVDLIYHDLKVVGEKKKKYQRKDSRTRQLKKPILRDLLMHGNLISNSSVVIRKSLLEKAGGLSENPKMIGAEDFNIWLKIANLTNNFVYVPEYLGFYEFHENGISRKDMSECYLYAIEEFINSVPHSIYKNIIANTYYMKAKYYTNHKNFDKAFDEAKKSFKNGIPEIKIKSLYLLINSFFRIL